MKRILHVLVLLMAMTSSTFAATDDIGLYVKDIIIGWNGGGGTKDVEHNAFSYNQYAENYWDIHDLSTNVYDKVEFTFAQAVNYDNINIIATYSDGSTTETKITNGATSHTVNFDANKTLVKIAITIGWDGPSGSTTIYFDSIIIRAKDSTGIVGTMPVGSPKLGKGMANPLLDFHYIADPTAIEYNGRLYVYGTNDHQQYEAGTPTNSYEAINSLVVISTDDMVNWTYHGLIDTKGVAPWIMASWAPTIISKPQTDGSTLFSLYFSNSGTGSGVIQAKSPLGPWTSPLTQNLTDGFDPGAVVDDNGDAWLAYGNGTGKIVKLGADLHSIAAGPVLPPTPYHLEANELNYINGTYVYTYNDDWIKPEEVTWTYGGTKPTACCMLYFTSKTPLDANSWTYGANYFKNTGENGMNYGNNHTHLHKYQGKWYLFYQANNLEASIGTNGGFRSIYVDEIEVDETNVVIKECTPTFKGVSAIKTLDPYTAQYASTAAATLGIVHEQADGEGHMVAKVGTPNLTAPVPTEGIIEVRNVEFNGTANTLKCLVKGTGSVTLRLDDKDGTDIATISSTGDSWQELTGNCLSAPNGNHTVYLILSGDVRLDKWVIGEGSLTGISTIQVNSSKVNDDHVIYSLSGQRVNKPVKGVNIVRSTDGCMRKKVFK